MLGKPGYFLAKGVCVHQELGFQENEVRRPGFQAAGLQTGGQLEGAAGIALQRIRLRQVVPNFRRFPLFSRVQRFQQLRNRLVVLSVLDEPPSGIQVHLRTAAGPLGVVGPGFVGGARPSRRALVACGIRRKMGEAGKKGLPNPCRSKGAGRGQDVIQPVRALLAQYNSTAGGCKLHVSAVTKPHGGIVGEGVSDGERDPGGSVLRSDVALEVQDAEVLPECTQCAEQQEEHEARERQPHSSFSQMMALRSLSMFAARVPASEPEPRNANWPARLGSCVFS